jgi:hypothetical protein
MHRLGREFEVGRKGFSAQKNAQERKTQEHRDENKKLQQDFIHGYLTIGDPPAEGNSLLVRQFFVSCGGATGGKALEKPLVGAEVLGWDKRVLRPGGRFRWIFSGKMTGC